MSTLMRQFIKNEDGETAGVILPIEEFSRIEPLLEQVATSGVEKKLQQMEQAMRDSGYVADLSESMSDFAAVDGEWWERKSALSHN